MPWKESGGNHGINCTRCAGETHDGTSSRAGLDMETSKGLTLMKRQYTLLA